MGRFAIDIDPYVEIRGISQSQWAGFPADPADTYDWNKSLCGMVDVGGKTWSSIAKLGATHRVRLAMFGIGDGYSVRGGNVTHSSKRDAMSLTDTWDPAQDGRRLIEHRLRCTWSKRNGVHCPGRDSLAGRWDSAYQDRSSHTARGWHVEVVYPDAIPHCTGKSASRLPGIQEVEHRVVPKIERQAGRQQDGDKACIFARLKSLFLYKYRRMACICDSSKTRGHWFNPGTEC
ncbi:hypothetical protein FB451DRAFT_1177177 [Mycena latifolia]|nr:hypothetical protein FB451DRAFT_1177177 [Mycena latifolia]